MLHPSLKWFDEKMRKNKKKGEINQKNVFLSLFLLFYLLFLLIFLPLLSIYGHEKLMKREREEKLRKFSILGIKICMKINQPWYTYCLHNNDDNNNSLCFFSSPLYYSFILFIFAPIWEKERKRWKNCEEESRICHIKKEEWQTLASLLCWMKGVVSFFSSCNEMVGW